MSKPSFEEAKRKYLNRFTMEHVPQWAKEPVNFRGDYYAPQFKSDKEWYENTKFPGEPGGPNKNSRHCESTPTWPLGKAFLKAPFTKRTTAKNEDSF